MRNMKSISILVNSLNSPLKYNLIAMMTVLQKSGHQKITYTSNSSLITGSVQNLEDALLGTK
jgi:hypothetical protein